MSVSRSLELPDGYQHYDWDFDKSVHLCDPLTMVEHLEADRDADLNLYTQHEIFLDKAGSHEKMSSDVIKHTRSSPNWDGGLATFATCKHLLRTYDREWRGAWLVGLCPRDLATNTILFVGRIDEVFESNYALSRRILEMPYAIYEAKSALTNPRGDLYTPKPFPGDHVGEWDPFDHANYVPPTGHTRSEEFYEKSPGSQPGPIPKWWRDLEYRTPRGARPKSFILRPFHLFSRPTIWTNYQPGRATLRLTAGEFAQSLRSTE